METLRLGVSNLEELEGVSFAAGLVPGLDSC